MSWKRKATTFAVALGVALTMLLAAPQATSAAEPSEVTAAPTARAKPVRLATRIVVKKSNVGPISVAFRGRLQARRAVCEKRRYVTLHALTPQGRHRVDRDRTGSRSHWRLGMVVYDIPVEALVDLRWFQITAPRTVVHKKRRNGKRTRIVCKRATMRVVPSSFGLANVVEPTEPGGPTRIGGVARALSQRCDVDRVVRVRNLTTGQSLGRAPVGDYLWEMEVGDENTEDHRYRAVLVPRWVRADGKRIRCLGASHRWAR